jgi:hypothetical protein
MSFAKERLNRIVNIVLAIYSTRKHFLMSAQVFVQHVDEIPAAIGAGDLAIAK